MEETDGGEVGFYGAGRLAVVLQVQHITYQMLAADVLKLLQMVFCGEVSAEPFAGFVVTRLGPKAALTVVPCQLVKLCDEGEKDKQFSTFHEKLSWHNSGRL